MSHKDLILARKRQQQKDEESKKLAELEMARIQNREGAIRARQRNQEEYRSDGIRGRIGLEQVNSSDLFDEIVSDETQPIVSNEYYETKICALSESVSVN